ncbi:hypothetical protein [Rickettsiella endosymbiont of Dermanyssus gallinae]|uniref:hypothetical protein n=1 Tax=Rickettsiella endosymbiont of Dermanyssus gallinae TaxID=2856608 RepID=UPI001C52948F|nr:hypothetical protein [Rickettsiella endosymbiont of Dermanyssus gallinae]
MNLEDFTTLKTRGDGNCLFRSIIQSLLVQGLIKNEKIEVMKFIHGLVQRTKEDLELNDMEFRTEYKDEVSQYNAQVEGSTLKLSKPVTFNNFIAEYNNLSLENLSNLLNDNEPVLYYLSACLRKDILSYHVENGAGQNLINDFGSLHTHADIINCSAYLNEHKIKIFVATEGDNPNSSLSNYSALYDANGEKTYKIDIHLKYTTQEGGPHYDALLLTKELDLKQGETIARKFHLDKNKMPEERLQIEEEEEEDDDDDEVTLAQNLPIKESEMPEERLQTEADEEIVKKLQVEKGVTLAKTLQMEEIECFAEKFKSSGNKNNQSFINDVIKSLRLDNELDAEQLSRLHALQTIKEVVESLQSIINETGYSSQFKEQIQNHSFFSTPTHRPEIADTAQTLGSTPAIKCH